MRRLFVALLVLLLALSVTGCGGGGEETAEAPAATEEAAPPPAPAGGGGNADAVETPYLDRSEIATQVFVPVEVTKDTPKSVADRVGKRPMLIFFYDSAQKSTNDQREAIDEVLLENRGLIDLVTFDLGKYVDVSTTGTVTVDPALENDPAAIQAVSLTRQLGVNFTPFIVIVDEQGYVTWRARGYADPAFIEREVQRATK